MERSPLLLAGPELAPRRERRLARPLARAILAAGVVAACALVGRASAPTHAAAAARLDGLAADDDGLSWNHVTRATDDLAVAATVGRAAGASYAAESDDDAAARVSAQVTISTSASARMKLAATATVELVAPSSETWRCCVKYAPAGAGTPAGPALYSPSATFAASDAGASATLELYRLRPGTEYSYETLCVLVAESAAADDDATSTPTGAPAPAPTATSSCAGLAKYECQTAGDCLWKATSGSCFASSTSGSALSTASAAANATAANATAANATAANATAANATGTVYSLSLIHI